MQKEYLCPEVYVRINGRLYCSKCGRPLMQDSYHLSDHAYQCGFRNPGEYRILPEGEIYGYTYSIEGEYLEFRVFTLETELIKGPVCSRLKDSWKNVYCARFDRASKEIKESGLYNLDIWMRKFIKEGLMRPILPKSDMDVIYRYFPNVLDIYRLDMFLDIYRNRGFVQKEYDVEEELRMPLDETVAAIFREANEADKKANASARDRWGSSVTQNRTVAVTGFEKYGELFLMIDTSFSAQRIILSKDFLVHTGVSIDLPLLLNGNKFEKEKIWPRSTKGELEILEYPEEGVIARFAERYPSLMLREFLMSGGKNPLIPLLSAGYDRNLELLSKSGLGKLCNIWEDLKRLSDLDLNATDVKGMFHLPVKLLKKIQEMDKDTILLMLPHYIKTYAYNPAYLQVESFTQPYNALLRDCSLRKSKSGMVLRPSADMAEWSEKEMLKTFRYVSEHLSHGEYTLYRDYIHTCVLLQMWQYGKWPKQLKKAHDEMAKLYNLHRNRLKHLEFCNAVCAADYVRLGTETESLADTAAEKVSRTSKVSKTSKVSGQSASGLSDHEPYIIVLPKEPDDLARESAALHHCVVTYADRVAKGDTYILFLRKREEPEKPFATIEVLPAGKKAWMGGVQIRVGPA
ncbi:MAG: PcfJ domain-containing protein [Lachnospiraceae bacterium]|nr:PcfJ domain-containing protein [Lachnospiraceae bacterium]